MVKGEGVGGVDGDGGKEWRSRVVHVLAYEPLPPLPSSSSSAGAAAAAAA